jgi:hypothetical protein
LGGVCARRWVALGCCQLIGTRLYRFRVGTSPAIAAPCHRSRTARRGREADRAVVVADPAVAGTHDYLPAYDGRCACWSRGLAIDVIGVAIARASSTALSRCAR